MSIIRRIIKKVEDEEEENDVKELTVLHPAVDYTPVPSICYKPPTTYDYRSHRQYKQRTSDSDRDYKKTACDRERKRMDDMNKGYDALRKILPRCKPPGKKLSKIETLRLAIRRICYLQSLLQGDKMYENNFLTNSDLEEQQYNAPSTSWAVPYYPSFGLGSPHSYYSYQLDPSQYPQYKTRLKLL